MNGRRDRSFRKHRPSDRAATMAALLAGVLLAAPAPAAALLLENAAGDGQVSVGVDGYGSFGYEASGTGTGDAIYDPIGPVAPSSTSWESAVYFRKEGQSRFLSTGVIGTVPASGSLPDLGFASSLATVATSTFTYAGLEFALEQRLLDAFSSGVRSGSVLVQTYTITNPATDAVSFDLVRYYEGDLKLGGAGIPDGGGHLFLGPAEYVFETDEAGQPAESTNFVGITAVGGTIPTEGRWEVGLWTNSNGDFASRIAHDLPLGDVTHNDGVDADEFVDAGKSYDVGIALANQFTLGPGAQATYVTTTLFGTGAPESVEPPTTVTTTTTTTTLPSGEVCDNCLDDDGDGRTDYEDPACCAGSGALALKRGRIRLGSTTSRLVLRGLVTGAADLALATQAVSLQLRRQGAGETLCARIPAGMLKGRKKTFRFRDKASAVASANGVSTLVLKTTRRGIKTSVRGRKVTLANPGPGLLQVTVALRDPAAGAAARCAATAGNFRAGRKGPLRYP